MKASNNRRFILASLATAIAASLCGCANGLSSDIRSLQAKALSPRIALAKPSGEALSSGGSLDLGGVLAGQKLEIALAVKNEGKSDLTIASSGIALAPSAGTAIGVFSLAEAKDIVIAPGGSASVAIAFAPITDQSYSATLSIASNDIEKPTYSVSLSGSGYSVVSTATSFSSITTSSAIGGGSILKDGGDAIAETGLCWTSDSSAAPTVSGSTAKGNSTSGSFTASMTGLSAGVVYYVRAYAKNGSGVHYGAKVSIITLPDDSALVPVAETQRGSSGSGKLKVSWSAVTGASSYNVYASTGNGFSAADLATGGSGVAGTSCVISGLSNYATYYVWVLAANASGSSPAPSASAQGYVGVPVTSVTLQRAADRVAVSGGRTSLTLVWNPYDKLCSRDTLVAAALPSDATETGVDWTTSGLASITVSGSSAIVTHSSTTSSAGTGSVTATARDGQGKSATCSTSTVTCNQGASDVAGPAGGTIIYDNGAYNAEGWRYLEAVFYTGSETFKLFPDGTSSIDTTSSTGLGAGKANTEAIVAQAGSASSYAVKFALSYGLNGYSDFYIPSSDEFAKAIACSACTGHSGWAYWTSIVSTSTGYATAYTYSGSTWTLASYYAGNPIHMLFVRRF